MTNGRLRLVNQLTYGNRWIGVAATGTLANQGTVALICLQALMFITTVALKNMRGTVDAAQRPNTMLNHDPAKGQWQNESEGANFGRENEENVLVGEKERGEKNHPSF